MVYNEAKIQSQELTNRIMKMKSDILECFPFQKLKEEVDNYPELEGYKYTSPNILNFYQKTAQTSSMNLLELYNQYIICRFISEAEYKLQQKNLPEEIIAIYIQNFKRITAQIKESSNLSGLYLYPNDSFAKDLAVSNLRMIPAGAQKLNLAFFPKKVMLQEGTKQFFDVLSLALFKTGGVKYSSKRPRGSMQRTGLSKFFKEKSLLFFDILGFRPFFDMHTDTHDPDLMSDFNAEGWIRFYKRCADILKSNTYIGGVRGTSWFFDPKIKEVSPRLSYLQDIVLENGGRSFYIGPSDDAVKDATLKSKTRRKLYEEGKYFPTRYMLIWPRKSLIKWSLQ